MDQARFTASFGGLSHDGAFALMQRIEDDLSVITLALTINETDEALGLWETVAWFATAEEAKDAAAKFGKAVIAEIEQRDWVRESLAGLAPVTAGRFFLHGSHDRALRRAGGISMEIDAGTAFGTGHHGTTLGCLAALDAIIKRKRPAKILDLGTGTGVLALAAAKSLRSRVVATDIDAEAVRVTKMNARNNGALPFIVGLTAAGLHDRRVHAMGPYDLVFANILAKPLERLATGLAAITARSGILILSGLTLDQIRWIKACYRARGLALVSTLRRDNWGILVFEKRWGGGKAGHAIGSGYAENV